MRLKDGTNLDPRFLGPIAHRGLHDSSCSENGLKAFSRAIEAGLPFEYDIHLTKDGELVVFHDSDLKRMCGKDGILEEKTFDELRKEYRLLDWEMIPSFSEVLALDDFRVPMVIELKVYKGNYRALALAAKKVASTFPDPSLVTFISFDPRPLAKLGKSPFSRGLLVCKDKSWVLCFRPFFSYLDVEDSLLTDKKVVTYRKKGHLVNVWTIRDKQAYDKAKEKADMITFELLDPTLL